MIKKNLIKKTAPLLIFAALLTGCSNTKGTVVTNETNISMTEPSTKISTNSMTEANIIKETVANLEDKNENLVINESTETVETVSEENIQPSVAPEGVTDTNNNIQTTIPEYIPNQISEPEPEPTPEPTPEPEPEPVVITPSEPKDFIVEMYGSIENFKNAMYEEINNIRAERNNCALTVDWHMEERASVQTAIMIRGNFVGHPDEFDYPELVGMISSLEATGDIDTGEIVGQAKRAGQTPARWLAEWLTVYHTKQIADDMRDGNMDKYIGIDITPYIDSHFVVYKIAINTVGEDDYNRHIIGSEPWELSLTNYKTWETRYMTQVSKWAN